MNTTFRFNQKISAADSVAMFLLTVRILPDKGGQDIPGTVREIARVFDRISSDATFLHKFKVSGEPRVLAMVQITKLATLERMVAKLSKLGPLDIDCEPLIHHEDFVQNIGVPAELANVSQGILQRGAIYWEKNIIEYHGKSTEEFLDLWRRSATRLYEARSRGELNIQLYKTVAERIVHLFLNNPVPKDADFDLNKLLVFVENGANIRVLTRRVEFLDDYLTSIDDEDTD